MNFQGLRSVIKNIKSHISCPHCDNTFSDEDINVISSVGDRCVLVAQCIDCQTPILVTASIKNPSESENDDFKEQIFTEQQRLASFDGENIVTSDDVVNIHQCLKDFKGNFKELFGEASIKKSNKRKQN